MKNKILLLVLPCLSLSLNSFSQTTTNCNYDFNFKDEFTHEVRASVSTKIVSKPEEVILQFEKRDTSVVMCFHCIAETGMSRCMYTCTDKDPLLLILDNDSVIKLFPNQSYICSRLVKEEAALLPFNGSARDIVFAPSYDIKSEVLETLKMHTIKKFRITANGHKGMRQKPVENIEYEMPFEKAQPIPSMVNCISNVDLSHPKRIKK